MILGFSGYRHDDGGLWTPEQRSGVRQCIAALPEIVLHGGAEGSDEDFDEMLREAGMPGQDICIYALPHRVPYWKEKIPAAELHLVDPERGALGRNRIIAISCEHLLATPGEMHEVVRSGTWATVRYARQNKKPITIVFPDGSIKEEAPQP